MRPVSRAALLQTTRALRDKLATAAAEVARLTAELVDARNRIDSLEQALQLAEDERAAALPLNPGPNLGRG